MERSVFLAQLRSKMPVSSHTPSLPEPIAQKFLTCAERLDLFVARATAALSKVYVCDSEDEALNTLNEILGENVYVNTGVTRFQNVLTQLEGPVCQDISHDHTATFGISEAWIGVALTGTCVLTSDQHRGGSLLPPRHIILLDADDIVANLYDAYAKVGDTLRSERKSVFAFHTGPSRSADIEQTMALGVHGPGEVHIIVFAMREVK